MDFSAYKTFIVILFISLFIFGSGAIIGILYLMRDKKKKSMIKEVNILERDKNSIISPTLLSELNKVESLINTKKLRDKYDDWNNRIENLKDKDMPKVTDMLLNAEEKIDSNEFDEAYEILNKAEMEIYYVKTKTAFILDEIRKITMSEEKNREAVTKLKGIYRKTVNEFESKKGEYTEVIEPIELQLETIDKLFASFEIAMEKNEFESVSKIVKALDDLIKNLKVIVEEAPNIILMGRIMVPKKISDVKGVYTKMIKDGYNLDYINLDYNVNETEKKLTDIFDRLKLLNVEDSTFELKTLLDYYESLYSDFEKEKHAKKIYDRVISMVREKLEKLLTTVKNLSLEVNSLKDIYDLTEDEVSIIKDINSELVSIKEEFKVTSDRTRIKSTPYSTLNKECELIAVKLSKTEDKLEATLRNLSSLKEDELRAREELDNIRNILKDSKRKINSYKLPVIPKNYYVELGEAIDAIKELRRELDKKPIAIKTLNTRVDTARDLVLKLYGNTTEIIKSASLSELSFVYANRYRSDYIEIDGYLEESEKLFFKGEYKKSLDNTLGILSEIDKDITEKIMNSYNK